MPESKTSEWIWDGSQKNFVIFEDKVFERSIDGNGTSISASAQRHSTVGTSTTEAE
jgi:hypothetical protein